MIPGAVTPFPTPNIGWAGTVKGSRKQGPAPGGTFSFVQNINSQFPSRSDSVTGTCHTAPNTDAYAGWVYISIPAVFDLCDAFYPRFPLSSVKKSSKRGGSL